jgi:hypothetical protein
MFMRERILLAELPAMGNRTLLCGGRLNVAVDWWMGLFIGGVVVVPSACFLSTVPFHPSMVALYGPVFAFLYAATLLTLSASCVVLLSMTVLCDPGFVFPSRWSARRPDNVPLMEKEFDPSEEVHFCPVCLLFLARYDHHCGIVGACIGRRNYWSFVLFCTAVAVMCGLSLPASIAFLAMHLEIPTASASVAFLWRLFSFDVAKTLVAVGGAFYGGGYCCLLSCQYWCHILSNTHSHARRRQAFADEQARRLSAEALGPQPPPAKKNFSCMRSWRLGCADRRAFREVFSEHRSMELTGTALQRRAAEAELSCP